MCQFLLTTTHIPFVQSVTEKKNCFFRYWDNAGGEALDAALMNASTGARFIVSNSYLLDLHAFEHLIHFISKRNAA